MTIEKTAQRWSEVLANGTDVRVAEGSPSDFTAKVVRRALATNCLSVYLEKIHIVQHGTGGGTNERATAANNLACLKRVTDYIAIPDGNSCNGSADVNNTSSFFVQIAQQSEFSNEWDAAFNYLNPDSRLDFSDTVELLYIIDDTTIETVNDFARTYLR